MGTQWQMVGHIPSIVIGLVGGGGGHEGGGVGYIIDGHTLVRLKCLT